MSSRPHKYDMGIVGNCSFMAYIDTAKRVQWMCMPKFDSSFIFGGLLDKEKGGDFSVIPQDDNFTSHQYYCRNTNILSPFRKTLLSHNPPLFARANRTCRCTSGRMIQSKKVFVYYQKKRVRN